MVSSSIIPRNIISYCIFPLPLPFNTFFFPRIQFHFHMLSKSLFTTFSFNHTLPHFSCSFIIFSESIELDGTNRIQSSLSACNNFWSLMIACSLFLLAQLMLIFAWAMVWLRRQRHRRLTALMAETSSTHSSGCSTYGGQAIPSPSPFLPAYKGFHPANIAFVSSAHHKQQVQPGFRSMNHRNPDQ